MTPSSKLRKELGHPVIDADAHTIEAEPILFDFLRQVGGPKLADKCLAAGAGGIMRWAELSKEQRYHERVTRPPWGMRSKHPRDLATVMMPKLLHERIDDLGIDYCIVLPTLGMFLSRQRDDETRQQGARAYNMYAAEMFKGLGDRLCPAAVIPMRTPTEALAELEHAVVELKHKVIVIDAATARPIPVVQEALAATPHLAWRATWLDSYGMDSAYDYDPFWRRCEELKVAVCGHTGGHWGTRQSVSSYVHNHLGLFASGGDALCRALFMGGVMKRFSKLQVGFLEGGVSWAAQLLCDLYEHYEKRSAECLDEFDPKHLDMAVLRDLWGKYGGPAMAGIERFEQGFPMIQRAAGWHEKSMPDEFAAVGVSSKKELRAAFSERFYFGCEADDKMVAVAFNEKLHGTKLRAFFGSDMGHWDVEDMESIVAEAHKLVRKEILTPAQFRDFVFVNPALFHARANPAFFDGTIVEKEVRALLADPDA